MGSVWYSKYTRDLPSSIRLPFQCHNGSGLNVDGLTAGAWVEPALDLGDFKGPSTSQSYVDG